MPTFLNRGFGRLGKASFKTEPLRFPHPRRYSLRHRNYCHYGSNSLPLQELAETPRRPQSPSSSHLPDPRMSGFAIALRQRLRFLLKGSHETVDWRKKNMACSESVCFAKNSLVPSCVNLMGPLNALIQTRRPVRHPTDEPQYSQSCQI